MDDIYVDIRGAYHDDRVLVVSRAKGIPDGYLFD